LDQLYSEYARSSSLLLKELRLEFSIINSNKKYSKKGNLRRNLNRLITKLSEHDFKDVFELKEAIELENVQKLNEIFKSFIEVFNMSQNKSQYNYLQKIREIQKLINTNISYRILE